jgi:hypothetical protein
MTWSRITKYIIRYAHNLLSVLDPTSRYSSLGKEEYNAAVHTVVGSNAGCFLKQKRTLLKKSTFLFCDGVPLAGIEPSR